MPDEPGFGRRMDGPGGRRRGVRERANIAISLYSIEQSRVAMLADISESGCRLTGTALPAVGEDVLLKVNDVELFGSIVWKDGNDRGVQFDEPITQASIEQVRKAIARERGGAPTPEIVPPEGRRSPQG